MKTLNMLFFFGLAFSVHASVNYYIIKRGLDVLPESSLARKYFVVITVFFALSFIVGRLLENFSVNFLSAALIWIGAFWLALMIYLFFSILFVDLLRGINYFFPFFPEFLYKDIERTKNIAAVIIVTVSLLTVIAGHINTYFPVLKNYNITIDKSGGKLKELKAAVISDIHLGTIIGRSYLSKLTERINALKPDIILIPGDIIDEDIQPVFTYNIGEILLKFDAKYGVYAVTGNHEYIGGVSEAKKYLKEHNIKLLNDEAVLIDGNFYLVGREDRAISQFTDGERKPLEEIMKEVDKSYPVIMMDHQPFGLHEAVDNGIDLQLSGHTHHGQLFPFNLITELVYELSWGYKKKADTHFYVSCGVGGWGPPIRTTSRPEIVLFNISFTE